MLLTPFFVFGAFLPFVKPVIVSTSYGKIEGLPMASYPNISAPFKSVNKFLGVPFAAPPIAELRFKAPRPPKEWKPKVRSAKNHGNICLQHRSGFENLIKPHAKNFSYSEDCLYLDVYTPNVSSSLPVMVHIHGGGYIFGTSINAASDILALQGVVVVVIQYRLGPFGFLTTGDSAAPGNYGMLDQVEALKWVHENIANFGGNPRKVTIFGISVGGSSVGLHLLSPLSRDFFHQAIAESGVDLCPFAIEPTSTVVRNTKELAQKLACGTRAYSAMVACMREKKALDIQKASETIRTEFTDHYSSWGPVVDEHFLHDTPRNLRKMGNFKPVPFMIGFPSEEGASYLGDMVNNSYGLMESVDNGVSPTLFKSFLTKLVHARNRSGEKTTDLITDALEFMYTPWPDNSDKYALRTQLVDLIGDYSIFAPSHEVADIHSHDAPVYMYEFAHRAKNSRHAEWMGVVHADSVPFQFGIPLLPKFFPDYSAADRNVSSFVMAMYTNFARSGDPTVSGVTWKRYNSSHRAYLRVDTNPKMASSFYPRRMAFWNDYYPELEQVKFNTKKEVVSGASKVVIMEMFSEIILVMVLLIF